MTRPLSQQFASCMSRIRREKRKAGEISTDSWKHVLMYKAACSRIGELSGKVKSLKSRRNG